MLADGSRFGSFRIERLLGEGAMGEVYLAVHRENGRQVALKIPKFEPGDIDGRKRFLREAQSIFRVEHPNICRAHEIAEVDGTLFLAMDYIDGRPLSDHCAADALLPPRQSAELVRKLALALAEAHKAGVIHRDLKPSNIMIDTAGEPIVMDFGLARVVGDAGQSRLTQTGTIIGSPAYMSPEQVQGKTSSLGPATDIYSLGVVFYELLTGRLPFDGPIAVVMAKLLTKAAPPPRQFRPDLDPALEAVCLKMMAKKIADRYGSMNDVAKALAAPWPTLPASAGNAAKPAPPAAEGKGTGKGASRSGAAPTDAGSVGHGKTRPPAKLSAADAEALHQTARKCLARHDAVEAVRLLEEIPAAQRTEAMSELLQQTQRMLGEITALNRDIDQALSTSDARALKPAVKRLLELKPADPRARKLQKALQQPGGLAKFVASGGAAVTTNDGLLSGISGTVRAVVAAFLVAFLGMLSWMWHYLKTSGPEKPTLAASATEASATNSNQRGAGDPGSGPSELAGDRYALLVGVQKYANTSGLSELKFADADVEGLANVLKASGVPDKNLVVMTQKRGAENVRFLPTRDNILKELAALLRDRAADDTVIVALAGHGVQFKNDDQSWFCPLDADISIIRSKAKATLIPLGDVYKDLESSEAGFKLLLCDACRNDPFASSTRRAIVDLQSATRPVQTPPGGVAAFFSCSEGEVAFEDAGLGHGVFFHFVIEGLKGDADLDKDAAVSLPELEGFAKKRVSDHVRATFNAARQMPQVINNSRGLMTVATVRAKPAPPETKPSVADAPPATIGAGVRRPPRVVPVAELNSQEIDAYASLSPDGLTACWTREGAGTSQILTASRPSVGAPFAGVRTIRDGRHHAMTGNQLELIFVGSGGLEQLHSCWRGSVESPFSPPTLIDEFRSFDKPKAPWLSDDGRMLLFAQARTVAGGRVISEIFESTRANWRARWSAPKVVRLPASLSHPQWPSMTSDRRTLYLSVEGASPRQSPIVVGHRDSLVDDFGDFRPVTVGGKPLVGRAPRHVEAARELWFSQVVDADGRNWDLQVVKDYEPPFPIAGATIASPPDPGGSPANTPKPAKIPADAQVLNGRSYKFFAEKLGFWQAKKRCEEMGGRLPIIRSKSENDVVTSLLKGGITNRQGMESVWLGFTDVAKEGDWRWLDNSPPGYTNWGPMQPNNKGGEENYALLYLPRSPKVPDGVWADQPAESVDHSAYFVCEWDGVPGAREPAAPARASAAAPRDLGESDFVDVNCGPNTWKWNGGVLHCTGSPVGILRSRREYTDFELELEWRHLESAGNSGVIVWVSDRAIKSVKPAALPAGIECQILDHGYVRKFENQSRKKADWFTTHGDVFPTHEAKMTPFAPTSPDGKRSFPRKRLSKGVGEWNHYRIRAVAGEVRLSVNGEEVSGGSNCSPNSGYICLESEGAPIDFRNIRLRDLSAGAADAAPASNEPPFVDLFNGRDLSGWTTISSQGAWKVAGGVLTASAAKGGTPGGALVTTRDFSDFELDLEYRLQRDGNSGVFLRLPEMILPKGSDMFEVQLYDDDGPRLKGKLKPEQHNGAIHGVVAPNPRVAPSIGAWNRMTIRAVGPKIAITVNNVRVVDANLNDHADALKTNPNLGRTSGRIGFQRHGSDVSFRNIRIRDL